MRRATGWNVLLVGLALLLPVGGWLQPWLLPSRSDPPEVSRRMVSPVLLITVPGLRADRVGHLGGDPAVTPALDRLARESATFLRFQSTSNDEAASVAALMLGAPPLRTGVRGRQGAISTNAPAVPSMLRIRGYRTLAVLADPARLPRGLTRRFDEVLAPGRSPKASRLFALAAEALASQDNVFVWVDVGDLAKSFRSPDSADGAFQRYDAALADFDAALGTFLDGLRRDLLLENLSLCITGTRGAALESRPSALGLDDEGLRVPCLLRLPRQAVRGRRVTAPSTTHDLGPTLMEMARHSLRPEEWPGSCGRSLIPSIHYAYSPHRTAFAEGWLPTPGDGGQRVWGHAAFTDEFKLVSSEAPNAPRVLWSFVPGGGGNSVVTWDPMMTLALLQRLDKWREACGSE